MPLPDTTPHLGLKLLYPAQAQKETAVNEALLLLDLLLNGGVETRSLTTPPSSPVTGAGYLPAAVATGAWAGKENCPAWYHPSKGWIFLTPAEGLSLWVKDEDVPYTWNGSAWVSGEKLAKLGLGGATADSVNRLSVNAQATLFNHAGAGHMLNLNKNAAADTCSVMFQTGFSGRAEMGLAGDDNFKLKVSADGSAWQTPLSVDRTTGKITLSAPPTLPAGTAALPALCVNGDSDTGFYYIANNTLGFASGGVEKMRFGTNGISYDGGANYERIEYGTWTPTITGGTTPGAATYWAANGVYRRKGDVVTLFYRVELTSKGGLAGNVLLTGFPFASNNANFTFSGDSLHYSLGMSLTSALHLFWQVNPGQTTARLSTTSSTGNTTNLNETAITDTFVARGRLSYRL